MTIRPAGPEDGAAVRQVVAAAFGQPDEADLVERLRADGDAAVELVAESGRRIVGHILFSPMGNDGGLAIAALAPVSVAPASQNHGVGSMLVRTGLEACRMAGVDAVSVLGHPDYYPRFGFSAEMAGALRGPFTGPHFMALALRPGVLDRPVRIAYAPAFGLPADGEQTP